MMCAGLPKCGDVLREALTLHEAVDGQSALRDGLVRVEDYEAEETQLGNRHLEADALVPHRVVTCVTLLSIIAQFKP